MKIREQACDSNIVLSKFKFNCDECDKSIPDPLPQNLNHFMMIVGKPGSSKTTLLLNLICKRGKMYREITTLSGHTNYVFALAIQDSKLYSGSYDNTIKVWDVG